MTPKNRTLEDENWIFRGKVGWSEMAQKIGPHLWMFPILGKWG